MPLTGPDLMGAETDARPRRGRAYTRPVQTCPSCGEENPDRFRICGMCGAQLGATVVAEEVRKTVTVVFSDLKGSTPWRSVSTPRPSATS